MSGRSGRFLLFQSCLVFFLRTAKFPADRSFGQKYPNEKLGYVLLALGEDLSKADFLIVEIIET